jgi:hypothetical protein
LGEKRGDIHFKNNLFLFEIVYIIWHNSIFSVIKIIINYYIKQQRVDMGNDKLAILSLV